MNTNNKYFRESSTLHEIGPFSFRIGGFRDIPNLADTSSAMDGIAETEIKDELFCERYKRDDYTASLWELLAAFDTFTREKQNRKAGDEKNFDFSNFDDVTIYLLWQVRNTIHKGKKIDAKCKQKYEQIYSKANFQGYENKLDLPTELVPGLKFSIQLKNYRHVKDCVFRYIQNRVLQEEFAFLYYRATSMISDTQIFMSGVIHYNEFKLQINVKEGFDCGFLQKTDTGIQYVDVIPFEFDKQSGKIILHNGKSFSAKIVGRLYHYIDFNNKINQCITLNYKHLVLKIDLIEAYNCGIRVDFITKTIFSSCGYEYDENIERIILKDGQSFSAKNVLNYFEPTHPLASQF